MSNAKAFSEAFQKSYDDRRAKRGNQWQAIWMKTREWSNFMIYGEESVISLVAESLQPKLCRCEGEPFRLDAVFSAKRGKHWFPPLCAVEVENNPGTFRREIEGLLSVRCPLKVGITYTLQSDAPAGNSARQKLRSDILVRPTERIGEIAKVIGEDQNTEYLFLVGDEAKQYELSWYALQFKATSGLTEKNWTLLRGTE